VLLESDSIKWKSNDSHSHMCKHCKWTKTSGPKPLTVCRAFASTEWENQILSARHIQALAASKIPSSNITSFMKTKALPADTLPNTNGNGNVDLAIARTLLEYIPSNALK
jgi:hypothetical protein